MTDEPEEPEVPIQLEVVMGSTNVDAMGYDEESGIMVVQYRNGTQYRWDTVPYSAYLAAKGSLRVGQALKEIERTYGRGYRIG